jgi:predicted CXXCH cytochrome family protein
MVPCTSAANGRRVAIGAAVAATALLAAACAPSHVAWPRTPPPERPTSPAAQARAGLGPVVIHAPFAAGRCSVCHTAPEGGGALVSAAERLCAGCHADGIRRARPHPATRSCLACHAPHVSMVRGRIAGSEERMCQGCHATPEGKIARAHQGYAVNGARCTRCHDPHGGAAEGLLRTSRRRPADHTAGGPAAAPEDGPPRIVGAR